MTELPVKMELHVKVVSQIKDTSVFVFQASPQLIVNMVLATLKELKIFLNPCSNHK